MIRAEFRLPAGWMELIDALDETAADFAKLDRGAQQSLRLNVERVQRFVAGLRGERDAWVLLRQAGRIEAVLTMRGYRVSADGASDLVDALSTPFVMSEVDVVNRTVRESILPAGRAVETHDFSVGHDFESGTRPASERATVTIFPTSGEWAIDLLLVTQDLLLFEDSLEYLHSIAETILPLTEKVR